MVQERTSTKGAEAMQHVAEHYASELTAQFQTLNHFVKHAGEIGRAHENYLRGVLIRFLPKNIKVSTGFIASPHWTSCQQDILLYQDDYSTLFEVGDCTVIDHQSFLGTIEVKTTLFKAEFEKAINKQSQIRNELNKSGLFAIHA